MLDTLLNPPTTRPTTSQLTANRRFKEFAFLILGIGILNSNAFAFPDYTIKEKKDCRYCHVDASGGGPTNARGRYYKVHQSFEGYFKKPAAKKSSKNKKP